MATSKPCRGLDPEEPGYVIEEYILEQEERNEEEERLALENKTYKGPSDDGLTLDMMRAGLEPGVDLKVGSQAAPRGMIQKSTNTGPKGVLADYEKAKLSLRATNIRKEVARERMLREKAEGATDYSLLEDSAADREKKAREQDAAARKRGRGRRQANAGSDDDDDSEDDSDEDSDDEEFLRRYKQQRLQQLRKGANAKDDDEGGLGDPTADWPEFGSFDRVDSIKDMSANVHRLDKRCFGVVHVYDPLSKQCARLNLALEELADKFPHVRFIRIRRNEEGLTIPAAAMPTVLVYKGGKCIFDQARVDKEFGKEAFGTKEVATFLSEKGFLKKG